ncbi:OmpA family protein [Qipengyuania sp. GH1]|uniref:OmpA family protein n=1 Tax=Qipengyuania aestuarii TaxID=2867241 RepID=UPI001C879279|nr:OmpA family protein [Qipengyuania aestuarii]MBX7536475.1 OmpA family protein [Qipengyuania aestuarii]
MRATARLTAAGLALAGSLGLAGCKVEPDPAPEPTAPTDAPRSIFQEEPTAEDSMLPSDTLPPLETVLPFADGTAELTEAVRAELATVLRSPQVASGGEIVLRGHSDSAGSDEENLERSRDLANAVKDFLVDGGIDEERIEVIAFGEQNPLEPNALPDGTANEEGRAANRRVDLIVETGESNAREKTLIETLSRPEPAASGSTGQTPKPKAAPKTAE